MNEQVNQPTLQQQVFDYIKDAAEKIGDFAAKEIPPFIEEFLRWRFLEAGIELFFWVAYTIVISIIAWKWWKMKKQCILDDVDEAMGFATYCFITYGVTIACFFGVALGNMKDMVQIKVAPKVYLLEQCAEYLK